MADIKQYSRQSLEKRETGRLGHLYMTFFNRKHKFPEAERQLDLITEVLASRSMDETVQIYHYMQRCLNSSVALEDYSRAIVFRDMMAHYYRHILG